VFIIACLLIPIIGIGFYPKIVTQIYDTTTTKLAGVLRDAVPTLANKHDNKRLASIQSQASPSLPQ
jgi:NAD(P)H-quinone oxidoreductase subunit 4